VRDNPLFSFSSLLFARSRLPLSPPLRLFRLPILDFERFTSPPCRLAFASFAFFPLLLSSRAISSPFFAYFAISAAFQSSTSDALPCRCADSRSFRRSSRPFSKYFLALASLSALIGRLLHLRQQHGSFDLCINVSHLDFDNHPSLFPRSSLLSRTNLLRVDTRLRANTTTTTGPARACPNQRQREQWWQKQGCQETMGA